MSVCEHAISSDNAFLEHMIAHHQVGVDMAKGLISNSMNTVILEYLRDLIRQQQYEITVMGSVHRRGLPQQFSIKPAEKLFEPSEYQFYGIVGSGTTCDANMFMPGSMGYHQTQVSAMEREFLQHMIAHHQVAVDISRVMITKTNNQHIMALCYDIIRSQEHEISKMRDLLTWESGWRWPSNCF
jgi:uncharacterized protein (DUF305 family)